MESSMSSRRNSTNIGNQQPHINGPTKMSSSSLDSHLRIPHDTQDDLCSQRKNNTHFGSAIEAPVSKKNLHFHFEEQEPPSRQGSQYENMSEHRSSKPSNITSIHKSIKSSVPFIEDEYNLPSGYECLGYKIVDPSRQCLVFPPRPNLMNNRGWFFCGLLLSLFWPLSCLPCMMSCSYDPFQVPVYGKLENKSDESTKVNDPISSHKSDHTSMSINDLHKTRIRS